MLNEPPRIALEEVAAASIFDPFSNSNDLCSSLKHLVVKM